MEELEFIDRILTLARDAPDMRHRIFDFHTRLDVLAQRAKDEKNTAMILKIAQIRVNHAMTYSQIKSIQSKKPWQDITSPNLSAPTPKLE